MRDSRIGLLGLAAAATTAMTPWAAGLPNLSTPPNGSPAEPRGNADVKSGPPPVSYKRRTT
ncbi:MAG TPA: hypothetical protein VJA21_31030, partial [Verrucomicrobiae bacterium]